MYRHLHAIGITGALGGYCIQFLETANVYLQFVSLLIGISLAIWALIDKIKKKKSGKVDQQNN